jgi:hypothetical protein
MPATMFSTENMHACGCSILRSINNINSLVSEKRCTHIRSHIRCGRLSVVCPPRWAADRGLDQPVEHRAAGKVPSDLQSTSPSGVGSRRDHPGWSRRPERIAIRVRSSDLQSDALG